MPVWRGEQGLAINTTPIERAAMNLYADLIVAWAVYATSMDSAMPPNRSPKRDGPVVTRKTNDTGILRDIGKARAVDRTTRRSVID